MKAIAQTCSAIAFYFLFRNNPSLNQMLHQFAIFRLYIKAGALLGPFVRLHYTVAVKVGREVPMAHHFGDVLIVGHQHTQ